MLRSLRKRRSKSDVVRSTFRAAPGLVVVFGKDAAEERVDPEKREKRRRGLEGRETLGLDTVTRQRDVPTVDERHRVKAFDVLADIEILRG